MVLYSYMYDLSTFIPECFIRVVYLYILNSLLVDIYRVIRPHSRPCRPDKVIMFKGYRNSPIPTGFVHTSIGL